jgi:hypothetical protein
MELAAQRKQWPRLEPPSQTVRLNVLDVLLMDEGSEREERLWDGLGRCGRVGSKAMNG